VQLTFAQEKTISGTVVDETNMPLPGATVVIKGTTTGASTDFDGKYTITANTGDTLMFSYVGYADQEAVIATSNTIDISLIPDSSLDEIIVTALGIKREKSSIGAATSTLKSEEITEGSQTNLSDALKGKVAGVVISGASSDPGASSGVIIRGMSSITGDNQPLYIIDGIPMANNSNFSDSLDGSYDFGRGSNDINPDDIESISVVKGASASALYGSRGRNGVIIITTKGGKKNDISVNISSTTTFSDILRTPKYQSQFGQGWDGAHYLNENGSWGPAFDNSLIVWGNTVNNSQKIKRYAFQDDQLENFFDNGLALSNSISIAGGTENSTGKISYNNTNVDGIYPTKADSYERNTLSASFETKSEKLTIGAKLNYVSTIGSAVATGQGLSVMNNLMQIPNDLDITEFSNYTTDEFNNVSNYYTNFGVTNPYFTLNEDGSKNRKERFFGAFDIKYDLNNWSNLSYRLGLDTSSSNTKTWTAIVAADENTPNAGSSTEQEGSYSEGTHLRKEINHDLFYNLNLDLNEDFSLTSHFGVNYNERERTTLSSFISSLDIPRYYNLSNSSDAIVSGSNIFRQRSAGVFNSSTLNYKDMLFLNTNIRNDWYSSVPKADRSFPYGGANLAWNFTKTFPGIKNIVSNGKFRIGYGITGGEPVSYNVYNETIAGGIDNQGFRNLNFPVAGYNAFEVGNQTANPGLKAETKKEFEIGADLSFLKNRITVDFSYYIQTVEDLIMNLPLASSSGYTSQLANLGVMENKGIEALVNFGVFRKRDGFSWDLGFNYTKNNNLLKELDPRLEQVSLGGLSTTGFIAIEGEPLGLLQGNVPLKDPNGNIVVDNNGVPIAATEKEIYGDTQYDYTLGINNSFSYKNISFGFAFDIRQGGLMYSRTAEITRFTGNSITTVINDRQPYIIPGSVQQASDGSGGFTYSENTTAIDSEHWDDYYRADALDRENVIDKSFVKLREVTLGYKLSTKMLTKLPFNELSFTLVGRNLLLFTPESNQYIDPETSTFGTDLAGQFGEFSANPSTKSIGFNIKASF